MMSEDQQEQQPSVQMSGVEQRIGGQEPVEKTEGTNVWKVLGIGCGAGCLVIVIIAVIAVVVFIRNLGKMAAFFVENTALPAVKQSNLPEDQKASITRDLERLATALRQNQVTLEQAKIVAKRLEQGPLMPYVFLRAIQVQHIANSNLSADEKQNASLQIQRFMRGVVEGKIPNQAAYTVMDPVTDRGSGQRPQIKQKVTEEEVRAFIKGLKQKADEAQVPNEPYEIDVAEEIHKIVVDALGEETGGETPKPAPAGDETSAPNPESGARIPALRPVA